MTTLPVGGVNWTLGAGGAESEEPLNTLRSVVFQTMNGCHQVRINGLFWYVSSHRLMLAS